MAELLAVIKSFAAKVKDDPAVTDIVRFAAQELHDEVDRLLGESQPAPAPPAQEAPPADPAPPAEG